MERPIPHALKRAHRWALLLGVTTFAVIAAIGMADAARVSVLGAAAPARPNCPNNCTVEGRVTALQTSIGNQRKPFRVPGTGKIVAWSIKLGKLNAKDRKFFDDLFGGASSARLAVLKPIRKKKLTYRLQAQSPVEKLTPFFGTTTTFALDRPIKVKEGQLIALTLPTWAPEFVDPVGTSTTWMGSRKQGNCEGKDNVAGGKPQQGIGTQRRYGCRYAGTRHLFSATLARRGGDA